MSELRVPSLQHLARNWRSDPGLIARVLVRLVMNPPRFNYNPLYSAVRDLLVLVCPTIRLSKASAASSARAFARTFLRFCR
jgi:hypothetical protein